jgi:hypothetical protein
MKKYIILFFVLMTVGAFSQPIINSAGLSVTYDTTGTFAQPTLVGNKGILKFVGTIDMRDGLVKADSVGLFVSFSDSIRMAFYFMPKSKYKTPTIADTVAAVLPPATATYYHSQDGAGQVAIPWYKLKAALTDLTIGALQYDVYVRIVKVAGLHTYGLTASGKAAGAAVITAGRQF